MFATNHVLMGALIAQELPAHPVLACVAAFISHFLIDIIPHGDTALYRGYLNGNKRKVAILMTAIDTAVAVGATVFLLYRVPVGVRWFTFLVLFISAFPDIVVGIHELWPTKVSAWFHRMHFFFHGLITRRTGDVPFVVGIGIELTLIFLIVWAL